MAPNFSFTILVTNLHHRRNRFSRYNKSRSNLQTDVGNNQHFNNNHEEKESTVKDSEKTRTFYEQLSDIISNINRNVLIITEGDFNAKTKMHNRDPLLNKIIGKYVKSNVNENGEKFIELCNLHNLRITNTFFKHKRTHQTTWTSPAPYKNVNDSKTKSLRKNPYRNQIDYILVRNRKTIKITDSKSTTNKITCQTTSQL